MKEREKGGVINKKTARGSCDLDLICSAVVQIKECSEDVMKIWTEGENAERPKHLCPNVWADQQLKTRHRRRIKRTF